jgi:hypothetical protein
VGTLSALNELSDRLKRGAAEWLWNLPRHRVPDAATKEMVSRLTADGYCVVPDFLPRETADMLARASDAVYESHRQYVSLESNGSDQRIYGVDRVCPPFRLPEQMAQINELSRAFYWSSRVAWFQMLGRITASDQNLGSGSGWHRDSPFSHQFKAILYLSDVTADNGPFEFIRGTHRRDSLAAVCESLNLPGSQYRFQADQIERLVQAQVVPPPTTFIGGRGTLLLIDSRGLHRGQPLRTGTRLAVTRYYFPRRIPEEFTRLYPLTAENPALS